MTELPSYQDLPVKPGAPPGSSWGVWGDDDQLGTLNLLTDERTLNSARLVRRGRVFGLNLPLGTALFHEPPKHHFVEFAPEGVRPAGTGPTEVDYQYRESYIDRMSMQTTTQWDGLPHARHPDFGNYNGIPDSAIHGDEGSKLGVDQWARRAIVGRGVLLDVTRYLEQQGRPYDVASAYRITVDDLKQTAIAQDVKIETGDILLFHTGVTKYMTDAPLQERAQMLEFATLKTPGLDGSLEMVEYLWDLHIAAIASDSIGVEVLDVGPDFEFDLHLQLLPLIGMPMGEFWALDELAADCAHDGCYEFQLVSVPLNLRGAIASPPQAVAIK